MTLCATCGLPYVLNDELHLVKDCNCPPHSGSEWVWVACNECGFVWKLGAKSECVCWPERSGID